MSSKEIKTYSEFWLFYVSEHSHSVNRLLHFIGSTSSLILLIALIATGYWYFFPACLVVGYGFAWFGHFVVEKNKPATFKYPLWSFISDWKMVAMMIAGKMGKEVEKAKAVKFA
jgi:hypothetical protein